MLGASLYPDGHPSRLTVYMGLHPDSNLLGGLLKEEAHTRWMHGANL